MTRQAELSRAMTVVLGLFALAFCVTAEELIETDVVLKSVPEVKQSSSVRITINGKDLLNELQTELELLEKADVDLTRELDRLVITSDTMRDELTRLLEKTRALMRERTGSLEIVREQKWDDFLREKSKEAAGLYRDAAEQYRTIISRRMQRPSLDVFEQPWGFNFFISDRYAYTDGDRERAGELEHKSRDLARQHARTDDEAERTQLASELRQALNELFDLKMTGYKNKMSAIEKELERLRKRVEEREKHREFIVTSRFKELVGEDNHLRW